MPDLHRPLVMTANIRGGDDRNCQNLGVGDPRPYITALPRLFHQRVDHDKSRHHRASDRRLLLAAMFGWATAIVPEVSVVVNEQSR